MWVWQEYDSDGLWYDRVSVTVIWVWQYLWWLMALYDKSIYDDDVGMAEYLWPDVGILYGRVSISITMMCNRVSATWRWGFCMSLIGYLWWWWHGYDKGIYGSDVGVTEYLSWRRGYDTVSAMMTWVWQYLWQRCGMTRVSMMWVWQSISDRSHMCVTEYLRCWRDAATSDPHLQLGSCCAIKYLEPE